MMIMTIHYEKIGKCTYQGLWIDSACLGWDGNENIEASGKEIENFVLAPAQLRYP